jgi:D-3-phosphoglycerate dehydrogenase / 2-oxoglutarate reductase
MSNQPTQKNKTKILLLENIHPLTKELLGQEGFQVETLSHALKEPELKEKIHDVNILGIRSKTQITETILKNAPDLLSVACFCIGTNHVDLHAAQERGIAIFNSPFSNTRSVAEMIAAEIIMLSRQLGDRIQELHTGRWKKVSKNCYEIRGKTLGIIGYGHIGSQLGVLTEALGMRVIFYDIASKMAHGNNQAFSNLSSLLEQADFVTLHVPATPQTKNMISTDQIKLMKKGSYLLNASRSSVVDIQAAAEGIRSGHLAGGAFDVFPDEPESNSDGFKTVLQGLPNVILTPHVGGSTEEAQVNIAREVATILIKFITQGATAGAVNFPQIESTPIKNTHRILNIHKNVPGVLRDINKIVSDMNANIHNQMLSTNPDIGYLIMDLDQDVSPHVLEAITKLKTSIRTRIVY